MKSHTSIENKSDQQAPSANLGKIRNPPRNKKDGDV
jgi:hypothetical protein